MGTPSITNEKDSDAVLIQDSIGRMHKIHLLSTNPLSNIPLLPICLSALRPNRLWSAPYPTLILTPFCGL